jgi:hypothetical protein
MTDTDPNADLPPERPIEVDANGDFVRQGSLMGERQSYERVIDGLAIMAEAAAHIAQRSVLMAGTILKLREAAVDRRRKLLEIAVRLDAMRLMAVRRARLDEKVQKETNLTPNPPMAWKEANRRFRFGAKQAEGGFAQLATCHRGELLWSQMAQGVKRLADQVTKPGVTAPRRNPANKLILPEHLTRQ